MMRDASSDSFALFFFSIIVMDINSPPPPDDPEDTFMEGTEEEEQQPPEAICKEPIEEIIKPIVPIMNSTPPRSTPNRTPRSTCVCKINEKKWEPFCQSTEFQSNNHCRQELIIEPPASFDGASGQFEASFDEDNRVFVFKIAPNQALSNPDAINGCHEKECGIVVAQDSVRDQAFKKSTKLIADKWHTFRHRLDWPGKPAKDLGGWWIDFADINITARTCPLLMINICSIKPVEIRVEKATGMLSRKTHITPTKMATTESSPMQQEKDSAIMLLQRMWPQMSDENKVAAAAVCGLTPDEVESAGEHDCKRQHGSWQSATKEEDGEEENDVIKKAKRWAIIAELECRFLNTSS